MFAFAITFSIRFAEFIRPNYIIGAEKAAVTKPVCGPAAVRAWFVREIKAGR
jgi:hypothetical protein